MFTGLSVAPSGYVSTDEIVELCKAVAHDEGVFYVTHARVATGKHIEMIEEAVEIGHRAEIPVQFSHLVIIDRRVYGHGPEMMEVFERARAEGLDITYDMYPYMAAGAGLDQTIPLWAQAPAPWTITWRGCGTLQPAPALERRSRRASAVCLRSGTPGS